VGLDLDKSAMEETTIKFARAARQADVALFYYSGHALQFAGTNYLMPVDASMTDEADLRRMTRVDEIVADLQHARNLRILVLDSCRDNPLAEQLKRSIGSTRAISVQRGLAKIDSPQGMIVAYATQAGRTAEDGTGRNSPYTSAFLRNIAKQEEIGTIFRRVTAEVYEATQRTQLPELSLSFVGEFYLNGKLEIAVSPTRQPDPCSSATDHWRSAESLNSIAGFEDHLARYSGCQFAGLARARIDRLKSQTALVVPPISPPPVVPPFRTNAKLTDQGVSTSEVVIGTHQDLTGPIKTWGVPVSNGMKLAVHEVNAAGGINGRRLRLVIEDSGYDPKKAVLATQKMIEKDKIFSLVGAMGSPTVLAAQDAVLDAGVTQLFPMTAAEFTYKFDPAQPQERLKFNNLLPYGESTRAALKFMLEATKSQKPCIMYQGDEYGKNVLDGFTQQLDAMKIKPASVTTYKRGASEFSAQISKMKADGCDLVVLGTVIRETIGAMVEARKLGWNVTFLGATPVNVLETALLGKEVVEGLYSAAAFELPYPDSAKAAVRTWLADYKRMFGSEGTPQAATGYNAVMTFAHYARRAGRELSGRRLLEVMESGDVFQDIFGSPPIKFSSTNHLGTTVTQVQKIEKGRWVVVKGGLMF
jgi:branched-chain amino acid transport system substrate-binding protein